MLQAYMNLNQKMNKWLWWLVIIGILCALPIGAERFATENSAKTVEIVFDFRDIIDNSLYKSNQEAYINHHMKRLKQAGVTSMAVYESTLDELKNHKRVQLFREEEYALLTNQPFGADKNSTYLLFADAETKNRLLPIIESTFKERLRVNLRPWEFNGREGLVIGLPYEEAVLKPMFPDPISMDVIKQHGFQIVVRLSNRIQPFKEKQIDSYLSGLAEYGVRTVIFDGTAVTGYDEDPEKSNVPAMAALMKKHGIGAAVIEPVNIKVPQFGFNKLAYQLDYHVVRLHSISEKDILLSADKIAGRLELAVKDRNIRMLFINTTTGKDLDKGYMNDYMETVHASLAGTDEMEGAISRIQQNGYAIGVAEPFIYHHNDVWRYAKVMVLLGGVAMIALLIGYFLPILRTLSFLIGSVGVAGLYVLAPSLALQALALGVSTSAAVLSIIVALNRLVPGNSVPGIKGLPALNKSLWTFARSLGVSLIGAVYVIGLLNNITYILLLEQFRGVNILALAPVVLAGLYAFAVLGSSSVNESLGRIRKLLMTNISIVWAVLAAVAAAAAWFYLSRTGNEGQASDLERTLRTGLEELLGVRPRTKEFLISHPLFIVGAYLTLRYRQAIYIMILGAIGQASMIGTFTHLHTPLDISIIRSVYGIVFGCVIGIALIVLWETCARSWRKWGPLLKQL